MLRHKSTFSFFLLFVSLNFFFLPLINADAKDVFVLPELNVEYPAWEKNLELKGSPDQNADLSKPEFSNLITVSEVLDSLPGTSVVIPGGPGAVVSPKLGGIVGNKVLVIKDGIPINDPFTGSPDIGSFDSNSFEKVEVYKGNHASKWGNNGMGGVINLKSSIPRKGKLKFNSDGIGGFGYSFESGFKIGNSQLGFRKNHFYTPGWSAAASDRGHTERDSFESDNFSLFARTIFAKNIRLDLKGGWHKSLTELDSFSVATGLPVDSKTFRQQRLEGDLSVGITIPQENGDWTLSHGFDHVTYTGIDESNPFNEYGLESSRQFQKIGRSFVGDVFTANLELNRQETAAQNQGNYFRREIVNSFLAFYSRELSKDFVLRLSGRVDEGNNAEMVKSGNCSLLYHKNKMEIETSFGSGFRLPSFNERFYPNYGDPDLKSEYANTASLKLSYEVCSSVKFYARITNTRFRDLIGTVSTTDPAYAWGIKAANLGKTTIKSHSLGFEELKLGSCKLGASVEIIDEADVKSTGKQPVGIISRLANLDVEGKAGEFNWKVCSRWWGESWADDVNSKNAQSGSQVDLKLYRHFKNIIASAEVKNLLDNDEERMLGYNRPGKRFRLSLEVLF